MKNIIISIIVTGMAVTVSWAIFINKTYGNGNKNYDLIKFVQEKPELVRTLKNKYEEQVKQIESSLINTGKTPQDRLIEAVTDQLDPKK